MSELLGMVLRVALDEAGIWSSVPASETLEVTNPSYSQQRPTADSIVGVPGGFAFWAVARSATSQPPVTY